MGVMPSKGWAQTSNAVKWASQFAVMLSGGSLPSASLTPAAKIVTVQTSPSTKSTAGSSVRLAPVPDSVAAWVPLIEHVMSNHVPVVVTDSLNAIVMFALIGASSSPSAGEIVSTFGAASGAVQGWSAVAEFRAAGVAEAKSRLLLSVSVQPPSARKSARVALIVGAAPAPSKKFAPAAPVPYPTRSTIVASAAALHGVELPLQPSDAVVFTTATLPAPAAMAIAVESVMSGVGRGEPTAAFEDSWTRMYWPAPTEPLSGVMRPVLAPKLPVPVALVYWIDQPSRDTDVVPRLNSST